MPEPTPNGGPWARGTGNYDAELADTSTARDWRPLTIAEHYEMLSGLRDAAAGAAAEQWGNLAALLETTRSNVRGYETALRQDWRSQAAEPFFEYVEGTNRSLEEWSQAARANEGRLYRLADAIETAQTQMEQLYASYKAEAASIDENEFGAGWMGDEDEDDMVAMVKEKTEQSRRIMQTLADVFDGTVLDEAPTFGGPADARPTEAERARALAGAMPRGMAPGAAPGGGGGTPPGAPGGAPAPMAPPSTANYLASPMSEVSSERPLALATPSRLPAPAGPAPAAPIPPPTAPMAPPASGGAASRIPLAAPVIRTAGAAGAAASRGTPLAALVRPPGAAGSGPGGAGVPRRTPPAAPVPPGASNLQGRNAPAAPSGAPPGGGRGMGPQIPGRSGMPSAPGMGGSPPPGRSGMGGPPSPGTGSPPGRPGGAGQPGRPGMGSPGRPGTGMPPGGRPGATGRNAPNSPALPGRQGTGPSAGKPGSGMPPGGPGMPRSLQGSRANLGRPGAPGGRGAPGRGTTGRGAPTGPGGPETGGSQGLRGRSGPVRAGSPESASTTRAALRRGLDGRGVATPTRGPAVPARGGPLARPANGTGAGPARRRDEERSEATPQIVGDEELFAVKTDARAVIQPSEEKVHAKRPGPALGRG